MMQCMPQDQETLLTASVLENAIAGNADLWGLLQPYAHLNAGRTATGISSLYSLSLIIQFMLSSTPFYHSTDNYRLRRM